MDRIKSRRSQPKSLFCSPRRIRCFFKVDWSVSISWQRGTYLHSTFRASGLSFISARPRCGQGQIRNPEHVKIEWWLSYRINQNQPNTWGEINLIKLPLGVVKTLGQEISFSSFSRATIFTISSSWPRSKGNLLEDCTSLKDPKYSSYLYIRNRPGYLYFR